jgi:CBS domain-containing protein
LGSDLDFAGVEKNALYVRAHTFPKSWSPEQVRSNRTEMYAKGVKTMSQKSAATQRAMAPTSLKAQDIMQQPVIAASPRASLRDVATRLVVNEFSGMPIADADGRVVGVITEADIVRALNEGKRLENLTASSVMTGPAITVDVKTPIEDVMKSLEEHRIVRVPVTSEKKLVGIIARRDVIRAFLEPEFMAFGDL